MGLINDIAVSVDNTLATYVQVIFEGVAGPIRTLLGAMALFALMLLAINHMIQFRAINYSSYFHWFLRYILIYAFATIWSNFQGIYSLFMTIPSDYTTIMLKTVANGIKNIPTLRTDILDPAKMGNTEMAMDEFGHAIVWMAYDFLRDTSWSNLPMSFKNIFTGVVILIVGGIFTASCAILVLVSKIGFALAVSLAPLAIIMLMTEQTKSHFESWLRFTIGFVVLPLLTAALMALVLYTAGEVLASSKGSSAEKQLWFGFIFIMIASLYLLLQIPSMASALAGISVAAVGVGAGFAVAAMAKNAPSKALGMASKAYSAGQRVRDGVGVAAGARRSGASMGRTALSAISGMRQSAMMRQQRRDERLSGRIAGHNGPGSAARRYYGGSEDQSKSGSKSLAGSGSESFAEHKAEKAKAQPESGSKSGAGSGSESFAEHKAEKAKARPASGGGSGGESPSPKASDHSDKAAALRAKGRGSGGGFTDAHANYFGFKK